MSIVSSNNVQPNAFENSARVEWKNSPKIREEFSDNFNTFLSYRQAVAKGVVRIHSSSVVSRDQLGAK